MNNNVTNALIAAIASILVAWGTAYIQGTSAGKTAGRSAADKRIEELGTSIGILSGPQKMCRAHMPGAPSANSDGWNDSVIVPQSWTGDTCVKFAESMGSAPPIIPLLGCVSKSGFSWAVKSGEPPSDNSCGW